MSQKNNNMSFSKGVIQHEVLTALTAEKVIEKIGNLSDSQWTDGYLAFSNGECRKIKLDKQDIRTLLGNNRFGKENSVTGFSEAEGYLIEIGLWRGNGDSAEEIYVEREDSGFFVQTWKLFKKSAEGNAEQETCYYRLVDTLPRGNSLIRDAISKAYEVVVPLKRLHFFITVGGK